MPELLLPLLATLACLLGAWLCCRSPSALDQASLLPFADDPPAAERMTRATGRRCEVTTEPLAETSPKAAEAHLLA